MARSPGEHTFELFLMLLMGGTLCIVALLISRLEMSVGLLLGVGIAVTVLVFFKAKIAIYLLIFSMLLSPEFGVGGFATTGGTLGRGVTFRFDDFLLVIIAVSWLVKSALHKELGIFKKTPAQWCHASLRFRVFRLYPDRASGRTGPTHGRVSFCAEVHPVLCALLPGHQQH